MQPADDYLEVHVDETGDRGFGPRASPVFCLAACVFRHSKAALVVDAMRALNDSLGRPDVAIHAKEHLKRHDRKMEACERLGALKGTVRLLYVVLPKRLVDSNSYLRDPVGAYNYPSSACSNGSAGLPARFSARHESRWPQ